MPKAAFKTESQRVGTLPNAVIAALTALIDILPDVPSAQRVELRTIRSMLCRTYRIPDPQHAAAPQDVAQLEAELDGIPLEDAP